MGQSKSYIIHAAIMYSNGEVLEGRDYHSITILAQKIGFPKERIYGFINSSGDFVLPQEAAIIAVNAGQINRHLKDLTPDDLWPVLQTD